MKLILPTLRFLRNKYVLATLVFIVWILFLDNDNLFSQLKKQRELSDLRAREAYFLEKISETRRDLGDLQNNSATLERYAREHFYMKKANEDIFLILPSEPENEK
jgi:cell division protein FtsB